MRIQLLVLMALLALTGCSRHEDRMGYMPSAQFSHDQNYMPEHKGEAGRPNQYMAYEHSISLDMSEDRVKSVFELAQAACREAAAEQCTVLESRLYTGRDASATLKFRARPEGIKKILAVLAAQGGVVSQSTSAEDLAQPIADTSKKLEMLRDYRAKLEALRGRAAANIDSLIKVSKELAQVQSDIEALSGEKAHLVQRVETEILNVSLESGHNRGFWSPIWRALAKFGSDLSDGLASAITGVAYILPWLPLLVLFVWGSRKLWGRMKRMKNA